ncbi:HWE histidine kinase domain-containing protein [Parvularcula sp. LCG005]|uniref:HWE histidine kinase domain-containing protein n=1 Tax=Parvularcula sp. LCG005 TaxID=3078805 RepID=UPI002941DB89|nr:HWE histidine kinase domain-containing protein [Parvularcula sp. LCG005]WOI53904.1 HWE histidine kinase domain-containing protein [Parvularcula sp. LCG005]
MADNEMLGTDVEIDLTNCDREPIQFLGHVQHFGCLIAVSSDWIVQQASINVKDLLGLTPEDIIGVPFASFMSDDAVHDIRGRLQYLASDDSVERLFDIKALRDDDSTFDVGVHWSDETIIIEFERHDKNASRISLTSLRPMIDRIRRFETVEEMCDGAARQIRALLGFDRVMTYRFDQDGSGEVIAEARRSGVDSFLGLHYPATDIPKQARELYKRNLVRLITNVDGKVFPIVPEKRSDGTDLDLSLSMTRAVSPIHLEYLRNMGVKASMSISILRRGELWGLFACHHYAPHMVTFERRTTAELFAEMFSFVLEDHERNVVEIETRRIQSIHDRLMGGLANGDTISENFDQIAASLQSAIPCDGVVGWVNGVFRQTGSTPNEEEFLALVRHLNTSANSRIYTTDNIAELHPPASAYAPRASGLLSLPVSRKPRDYLVLFRKEADRKKKWAGNPEKPVTMGPNGARLTPRKSFEAWQESVREHSVAWTDRDKRTAEMLRVTLLEVVLRLTDAANRERDRAAQQQELLIAELNHRVRNILNLIRGVVSQSKGSVTSVDGLADLIGGRIQALARAHDQITEQNWNSSSLKMLIRTEVDAYLEKKADRVSIEGRDVLIQPSAFTTLSLVIHELTTNSAKYGALSDSRGEIIITLSEDRDGALIIEWVERNGPPVKAPTRRGFGSTIIEKSIPYELQGSVDLNYALTGLTATLRIPANSLDGFTDAAEHHAEPKTVFAHGDLLHGDVMIVEDNMIIALDAEDIVQELGATSVCVASNVEEALRCIEKRDLTFALLDVNLGRTTSEEVADDLTRRGIPFLFATGYAEKNQLAEKFPHAAAAKKPYTKESIAELLLVTYPVDENAPE